MARSCTSIFFRMFDSADTPLAMSPWVSSPSMTGSTAGCESTTKSTSNPAGSGPSGICAWRSPSGSWIGGETGPVKPRRVRVSQASTLCTEPSTV